MLANFHEKSARNEFIIHMFPRVIYGRFYLEFRSNETNIFLVPLLQFIIKYECHTL
jgi:hypothetical protein